MDRQKRPRACCREAAHKRDVPMPEGGAGVEAMACEQCVAPADDGVLELDGVRVCGRRHFYARLAPFRAGIVSGSMR